MHTRTYRRFALLAILGLILGLAGLLGISHPVRAQTMQVTIANFAFSPATLTISPGTTVTWINNDSVAHTSTSDTGVWDSGSLATGKSFSFTFNGAGTFPYHCSIHPFMKATIVVQSAAGATTTPGSTATPSASATPATSVTSVATVGAPTATAVPLAAYPVHQKQGMTDLHMGQRMSGMEPLWMGYYDGHKDTFLNTDVSDKAQATSMHVNFSAALKRTPASATPAIYLVMGRAAGAQPAVFGSEPGESDYSPLWREVDVQWKAGVKPILLVRDDQIINLAKQGKLTMRRTQIVLNCPIIKVGK